MTIFTALHDSHEIQRTLCRQLTAARTATARREALFLQLKVELEAHAAAEERFLYVPLLMSDAGLSPSRHALSEHHDIEELCESLSVRDKSTPEWLDEAKALSKKVHHHLKEEEKKFFQSAGKILTDAQKETLGQRYEKDLRRMRKLLSAPFATLSVNREGLVVSSAL